jgi:uncharacterized protein (DUF736 family)
MPAKRLGALWKKKTKEGKSYLSGNVEIIVGMPMQIAIFQNEKKTEPKQPDYNIVLSQPIPQETKAQTQNSDEF